MNLKESIISSFFLHLILFLLVIAAANYTAGRSGGIGKVIPVELAIERGEDLLPFHGDTEEGPLQEFDRPPDLPAQDMDSQPKEPEIVPGPEKKAGPETETAKTERALPPPIRTEGFTSLEAYYQFLILHKKIFGKQAGIRVNELIGEALKVNTRHFYGGTASVSLTFESDGRLREVHVDSASPDLKAFLEEIDWSIVPPPAAYSLAFSGVRIDLTVQEGYMNFSITPL